MQKWEYMWAIIRRDAIGFFNEEVTNGRDIWHVQLADRRIEFGSDLYNSSSPLQTYLNSLGEEGWELVATVGEHASQGNWLHGVHLLFKRPKA